MYDAFTNYPISCNWNCHIARGSSGGTDYGMGVGTLLYAAFDGQLTNRPPVEYPLSGNVAILTRADGLTFYYLHLSAFVTPGPVKERDLIGYSGGAVGAIGSGSSTGPHLHVNAYLNNVIRDVHDFYTTTASSSEKLITHKKRDAMVTIVTETSPGQRWAVFFSNGSHHPLTNQFQTAFWLSCVTAGSAVQIFVTGQEYDSVGAGDTV
jgi:murein DD-endopeptidase MepM/ murein hydrolase activator NlpD